MAVLKIKSLQYGFREHFWTPRVPILKDLNFEVRESHITGFLGHNGAGKSTTIKCILGLLFPEKGCIEIFGKSSGIGKLKSQIGFLPERPFFYEFLTASEFLEFNAGLYDLKGDSTKKIYESLEKVGLMDAKDKLLSDFSKGMLQRVGIAQSILHKPKLLILDEPMSGLDPDGRYTVYHIIKEIADQGTTVFFSSHLLHDVESLCQDLVVLRQGKCLYNGSTEELSKKINGKVELTYRLNNRIIHKEEENSEDVQRQIDQIRQKKGDILQIRNIQSNLEEAYIQLNKEENVN